MNTGKSKANFILTLLGAGLGVFASAGSVAQVSSTIEIIPNPIATPSVSELVTIGVPFSFCTLTDLEDFTLFDENMIEVPIFIKETLSWPSRSPCNSVSSRAIKVQFAFDATGGSQLYSWDLGGRTTANDIPGEVTVPSEIATVTRTPIDNTVVAPTVSANSGSPAITFTAPRADIDKAGFNEPRVFGINNEAYVVSTGIIPPTSPKTTENYDANYFPNMWEWHSLELDYDDTIPAHWLFDRVSTNYIQAARRGADGVSDADKVKYYREAYLSHEFYIDKIDDTGVDYLLPTTPADYCLGGFNFKREADHYTGGGKGCDSKYIYAQPLKLHLALTGDDTFQPVGSNVKVQDRTDLFFNMADVLFTGSNRASGFEFGKVPASGFSQPYEFADAYTERKSGLGLQTVLNVCELTVGEPENATVCGWADTIIENMYNHQTNNPDGLGNVGYLGHSWFGHETPSPWIGELTADVVAGTTITVGKTIGDIAKLQVGNEISIGAVTGANWRIITSLSSNATGDLTEVWTIGIDLPISKSAGERVVARRKDLNDLIAPAGTDTSINTDLDSDRAFSPWMQSNIADGIWQYYNWIKNDPGDVAVATDVEGMKTHEEMAEEILRGFGHAIASYGIDGQRLDGDTKTAIQNAFGVQIHTTTAPTIGCGLTVVPLVRYGSDITMDDSNPKLTDEYVLYKSPNNSTDQHIPELIYQLALGIYFETDNADKRAAMEALAEDMMEFYDVYSCTAGNKNLGGGVTYPRRAFNWQNKPDPFGTYHWVKSFAITLDVAEFTESVSNDGSIATIVNITLGGDTFAAGPFADGVEYNVTNLPAGLTAVVTRTGNNTATLALSGNATNHEFANSISNLELEFTDAAFEGGSALRVADSTRSDLAITYTQPSLNYDVSVVNENVANDGSVSEVFTITLLDDTFTDDGDFGNGDEFNASNIPAGMGISATRDSATQITIALTGNATAPHNTDVSDLTIEFTDAAFVTFAATGVLNYDRDDLQVLFVDPTLSYDAGTLTESDTNTGVVPTVLNLSLSDETFTAGPFNSGDEYNVTNLPAGLTAVVTRVGPTSATITLSGNAAAHEVNITDLTFTFLDAAFSTYGAAAVAGSVKSDLIIDYVNPHITYLSSTLTEDGVSDGSIVTTLTLTLSEDTFTAGPFNLGDEFTVANVPAGLTASVTRTGATTVDFTLTGNATSHLNSDDISNLGLSFTDNAFTNFSAAAVINASRSDLSVDFLSTSLSYDASGFVENNLNDGSIVTVIGITLVEDVFTAGPFNEGDEFNTANVPANLVATVTRTGDTTADFTLTGNALAHDDVNDISNLELSFTDNAFTTNAAAVIGNSTKSDFVLDFVEPGISYDIDGFTENTINDGSMTALINLTLVAEFFTAGPFTDTVEYDVSNVPAGLTAVVTRTGTNTATFALTGNATSHANANDIANIDLTFNNAAFVGGDASLVSNGSKSDITIDFIDAVLTYNSSVFSEAVADNGSISNSLALSLAGDTFVIDSGVMTSPAHYTVANLPAGLSLVITGTSATTATVGIAGTATSHVNADDISNLTINFTNAAFTAGDAAAVQNASKNNLVVNFNNPPVVPPATGSGSISSSIIAPGNSVTGATVRGITTNGGTLIDPVLTKNSIVDGGVVKGKLTGEGTIKNALLDVTELSKDIKVGEGSKVTASTVRNVPGLNLSDAVRNEFGDIDMNAPILLDDEENELDLNDIAVSAVNSFFKNSGTQTSEQQGNFEVSNVDLPGRVVPVIPYGVATTNKPDGITTSSSGEIQITSNGIEITYLPSPVNAEAFYSGLEDIDAEPTTSDDGVVLVEIGGVRIAFRFGLIAKTPQTGSASGLSVQALNANLMEIFEESGNPEDPENYRLKVIYPDGTSQNLVPYLFERQAFIDLMSASGIKYKVSAQSGVISILDNKGSIIYRGIPGFDIERTTSLGVVADGGDYKINVAGDLNGDGLVDLYFKNQNWKQIIYTLQK